MKGETTLIAASQSLFDRVQGAARLYHLLSQSLADQEFCNSGGKIVYVMDNDVVSYAVDPYAEGKSARYMRVLEGRNKPPADASAQLLSASGRAAMDHLISAQSTHEVILSPSHKGELTDTIEYVLKDYSTKIIKDATQVIIQPEKIHSLISTLEDSKGLDPALVQRLRAELPHFIVQTFLPKSSTLNRLDQVLERLSDGNKIYRDYFTLPPESDNRRGWLFRHIKNARKHLVNKRGEKKLDISIWNDVDAIIMTANLNGLFYDKKIVFHYLTGDRGIHEVIDGIFFGSIALDCDFVFSWPKINFLRRPVQLSRFLQPSDRISSHEAAMAALRIFLNLPEPTDFQTHLHRIMYSHTFEDLPFKSQSYERNTHAARLLTFALKKIEDSLKVSREAELFLDTSEFSNLMSDSVGDFKKIRDVMNRSDLKEIMVHQLSEFKYTVRKFSFYLNPDFMDEEKRRMDAFHDMLNIVKGSNSAVHSTWNRLPLFPRVPESIVREFFQAFRNREPNIVDAVEKMAHLSLGGVILFNVYWSALAGNWSAVAQQCDQILDFGDQQGIDEEEVRELTYVRALGYRHMSEPPPEKLRQGLRDLDRLCKQDKDPRYLGEKAAYGLAIPFHQHHYGGYESVLDVSPPPEKTWCTLLESEQLADQNTFFPKSSQIDLRFRTQLYSNFVNCYINSRHFIPNLFPLFDRFSEARLQKTVEGYLHKLEEIVLQRGGVQNVSYYVQFVLFSGRALLAMDNNDFENLHKYTTEIRNLEGQAALDEKNISSYDKEKFVLFFKTVSRPPRTS